MTPADLPALPPRETDAHKGGCGRVLVVATSPGMTGAGVLCVRAALRAGAGLATLAVPGSLMPVVGAQLLCAMSVGLPETAGALDEGALAPVLARPADVVALGPGLGRARETGRLVAALVERDPRPHVIDADALWHLASCLPTLGRRDAPTVLTPHPGEMAQLQSATTTEIQADRAGSAARLSNATGAVVVLKGAGTVVADGDRTWVNPTGNPGLATGGTGDVLTGVIAALIGQGMCCLDAARLAVYIHGLAGDLAAAKMGQRGMIASDVLDALPTAMRELE